MNSDLNNTLNTDVLVVGGGPAGIGAAIAAARMGFQVSILEQNHTIGGVMASCPGMPIGAAYPSGFCVGGILEEFLNALYTMTPPAAVKRNCRLSEFGPEVFYDHEIASYTLYQMLEQASVDLIFNASGVNPIGKDDALEEIVYYDKNGKNRIQAKFFIDCSGDGDLAAQAGVSSQKGDESQGEMMAVGQSFFMVNVDFSKIAEFHDPYFKKYASLGIQSGRLPPEMKEIYWFPGFHPDTILLNAVFVRDVDATQQQEVTRASIEARKRIRWLAGFLQDEIPGFEKAHVESLGPTIGVRETRRLDGIYRLTQEDIFAGKKFSDGVICCDNAVDDVYRGSKDLSLTPVVKKGSYYHIPLRCLAPKHINNLLFAGRCVSSDSVAAASLRGMATCMGLGQAAGTAAGVALLENTPVQELDFEAVIPLLKDQGVNGLQGD